MNSIKFLYFNRETIDSQHFLVMIRGLYHDYYMIEKNMFLIRTSDTPHMIYDKLSLNYPHDNILIITIKDEEYWGYMKKDLWSWLKPIDSQGTDI